MSDTNENPEREDAVPLEDTAAEPTAEEYGEDAIGWDPDESPILDAEAEEVESLLGGRAARRIEALYVARNILLRHSTTTGGFVGALFGTSTTEQEGDMVDVKAGFGTQLVNIADYIIGEEAGIDPTEELEPAPGFLVMPRANELVTFEFHSNGPTIVRAKEGEFNDLAARSFYPDSHTPISDREGN